MGDVRVLVLTHTGDLGGAERAMLRLIRAADRRFDIRLLALADGPLLERAREQGVAVRAIDGGELVRVTRAESGRLRTALHRAREAVSLVWRLRAAVSAEGVDLVVTNSLKAAVLYALVPGTKPPWVWHLHDRLAPDYMPTAATRMLRALARRPRAVVVNSLATAATVGRGARSVIVAYPGVERELFTAPSFAPAEGPIGMLGRVSRTKGQREFVVSASIVARSRAEATFCIVGDALFEDQSYADELARVIRSSSIRERIEWRGWSDDPAAALRSFGVFVHASPVPEPFGQVIVEAMAVGTPVIATDAGGVAEILDPDRRSVDLGGGVRRAPFGLLVRPGDVVALAAAIVEVLGDPDGAIERARNAHRHAESAFTIDRTWAPVAAVWERAARRTARVTTPPRRHGADRPIPRAVPPTTRRSRRRSGSG